MRFRVLLGHEAVILCRSRKFLRRDDSVRFGSSPPNFLGVPFVLSTLIVNITGSLLIGYLVGIWSKEKISPNRRHFWITGVCGGYTTFSALSGELLNLLQTGQAMSAGIFAALNVIFGLISVWVGLSLADINKK